MSAEDLSSPAQHLSSSHSSSTASLPQYSVPAPQATNGSKYSQLLCVIEELSKDIRPTYTGNKVCAERLKRTIIHARILVRECLMETDRAMRH